jgi:hypothetical protein
VPVSRLPRVRVTVPATSPWPVPATALGADAPRLGGFRPGAAPSRHGFGAFKFKFGAFADSRRRRIRRIRVSVSTHCPSRRGVIAKVGSATNLKPGSLRHRDYEHAHLLSNIEKLTLLILPKLKFGASSSHPLGTVLQNYFAYFATTKK